MEQQLSNTDASLAKSWSSKNGTATTSDYEEITTCKMEPQQRIYSQGVNGQETTETVEKKSTAYLNQHAEVDIRGTLAASRFTLANELNHGNFKINGVFKPKTLALMPPTTDSAATSSTSQDTEDAIAITTAKNKVDVSTPPTENQL
ncbi:hypothetical protein Tco_1010855 [Tanacetum coccineum]